MMRTFFTKLEAFCEWRRNPKLKPELLPARRRCPDNSLRVGRGFALDRLRAAFLSWRALGLQLWARVSRTRASGAVHCRHRVRYVPERLLTELRFFLFQGSRYARVFWERWLAQAAAKLRCVSPVKFLQVWKGCKKRRKEWKRLRRDRLPHDHWLWYRPNNRNPWPSDLRRRFLLPVGRKNRPVERGNTFRTDPVWDLQPL